MYLLRLSAYGARLLFESAALYSLASGARTIAASSCELPDGSRHPSAAASIDGARSASLRDLAALVNRSVTITKVYGYHVPNLVQIRSKLGTCMYVHIHTAPNRFTFGGVIAERVKIVFAP